MTHLTLLVPGLAWPAEQTVCPEEGVAHDALAWMLGRGRLHQTEGLSCERLLARLLGGGGSPLPLALLRRLGESGGQWPQNGEHWLCTDPINLSFMSRHLLPDAISDEEIGAEEVAALIAALNAEFASLGDFSAVTPTRWYLRLKQPVKAHFFSMDEALCRPILDFLPTNNDEHEVQYWRHMLNEIQITLHNHPVNRAREAAGRRPVNSLWFWGEGSHSLLNMPVASCAVQALDPVARGLARAARVEPDEPNVASALNARTIVVLDALASPARHLDLSAWQAALAALEREWFAPIAQALKRGALRHFELHVPGERGSFSLSIRQRARWYFWRKPLPLSGCAWKIRRGDS